MYKKHLKRLFDLIISILILPLVVFLILVFSPIIYLTDKGNTFYISSRLGKNGKPFNMIKLRSMKIAAPDIRNPDGSTYNSTNDTRVTKIGKFLRKSSLDELPQIFNVIKGDMSLIGPRPDLSSQISYYDLRNELKFKVKPGITGYAQVKGRNSISWKKKLELDRHYVNNLSFYLDLEIAFLTIVKIIKAEGVNKNEK
jgi:lipopolysaccharide/colanic/teichoic acid biosynthesis glycosyltransferase